MIKYENMMIGEQYSYISHATHTLFKGVRDNFQPVYKPKAKEREQTLHMYYE
jgi:hypothetical protein